MAANPLDIRTILVQVHAALVDVIDLAYSKRYPEAADLSALAAYETVQSLPDRALVFVVSEGTIYRWSMASTLPQVLPDIVAPTIPFGEAGNGRFLRQSSAVTLGPAYFRPLHRVRTGYLNAVDIYEGQGDEAIERISAQHPAVLVEWISGGPTKVKAYAHGSIYEYDLRFSIHALARNLRMDASALIGSDVAGDTEPGLYQLIGDLHYLLAGCKLGLAPGVRFTDITGGVQIVEMDLQQRFFRAELDIVVKASVHIVDEDLEENGEIWIERQDAGTPDGQPFDASNFVAAGYKFGPVTGLTAAPSAGVAYIGGQLVSSAPAAHTFVAEAETYRDLNLDGSLTYTAMDPGADPPAQRPRTLRVGLTVTDGSHIVADTYLCSFRVPSGADPGDPFQAA